MVHSMTQASNRRTPPKLSPSYIENAALHYLERYASSRANLRRVLMRKADRSLAHWGGERDEAARMVEDVMAKLARLGYVDDAQYAEIKVRALHRKGGSVRAIAARLVSKGVEPEALEAALSELKDQQAGEPDLAAALVLARRRRMGPYRLAEKRAEFRQKDLAALARAGFSHAIAVQVIDAADPDSLLIP
jgi:regulatory protein